MATPQVTHPFRSQHPIVEIPTNELQVGAPWSKDCSPDPGSQENIAIVDSMPHHSTLEELSDMEVLIAPNIDSMSYRSALEELPTEVPIGEPVETSSMLSGNQENEIGVVLEPKWKQYRAYCMFAFASSWVIASLSYFFLSSSPQPLKIFSKASETIFALGFLSSMSVQLLETVFSGACDILRWKLAASRSGVGMATFVSLTSSTGLWGILRLLRPGFKQRDGHHKWWGIQRVLYIVVKTVIPVALLFNLDFETAYLRVSPNDQILAGMAPFNISLLPRDNSNVSVLPLLFMYSIRGLLRDPKISSTFPPTTNACKNAGDDCLSYILPGELDQITIMDKPVLTPVDLSEDERKGGTTYISEGAPGYQLEYFPVQGSIAFDVSNCRIFGKFVVAVKICLKNVGEDLVVGWTACPAELSNVNNECFTSPDSWGNTINTTIQLHVSSFHTTTAFDLKLLSIQSVTVADTEPRTSVHYPADEIFQVFEIAMDSSRDTVENIHTSTQLLMLIASVIQYNSIRGRVSALEYDLLRTLLALPLYLINLVKMEPNGSDWRPPKDMYVTGYLAKDVYRIIIAKYSLYVYAILAPLVLVWAGCVIFYCSFVNKSLAPNLSDYPEFDFVAKCNLSNATGIQDDDTMGTVLKNLGNAHSRDIERRFEGRRLRVGATSNRINNGDPIDGSEEKFEDRVVVVSGKDVQPLKVGKLYL